MEGEEEGGLRLSKRFSDKGPSGEVDYKTKSGTAWSHSYLNQKPWHPLSYPNQRRKWISEQIHAQHERRAEEIAREYAQEQEFFRQSALISKKEKEKIEIMKAVSFMYVRPPGYNPESAKAAEIADEREKEEQKNLPQDGVTGEASTSVVPDSMPGIDQPAQVKKKPRPKDVFGRALPTEEEFEILKNAPRLDTGVAARSKPFAVEVRNVKCVRCGTFGHQSGDRECPLKDVIMPNEENRLKRDDPLTAILAHTDVSEPLKWELKQKPGMSPPRGGFNPDDPNQQIVAEDIFDEYGGFLGGEILPDLLTNLSASKVKKKRSSKKSKHRGQDTPCSASDYEQRRPKRKEEKHREKQNHSESSSSDEPDFERRRSKRKQKKQNDSESVSSDDFDSEERYRRKRIRSRDRWCPSEDPDIDRHQRGGKDKKRRSASSDDDPDKHYYRRRKTNRRRSYSSSSEDEAERHHRHRRSRELHNHHHRSKTYRHRHHRDR